jgi:nitrite reductase/ring-hydroxylating ferredoxin subunit
MYLVSRVFTTLARWILPGARLTPRLAPRRRRLRPHAQWPGASRRLTRREALGLLIAWGSLTLGAGASGIGLVGIARKVMGRAAQPAGPLNGAIGSTAQARNTAQDFVNPQTGHASLLMRLPDGAFVACEKACTHRGVFVAYDPATHRLVCPAHGAIFDPARKGAVVQGPATQPLPQVALRIDASGAITAG